MSDSLSVTDADAEAVAVAPRISKAFIESQITLQMYVTGDSFVAAAEEDDELQQEFAHHTICLLRVKNGFSVIGHSAPMSPANFDRALGERFAYEDAFRQLWPLFAFAQLEGKLSDGL